jgi:imidazolonepropionase-like amidohydrolase
VRRNASALGIALAIGTAACGGATQPVDAPGPASPPADVLVLNHFTLIDGHGGPAVPDSALIATSGRIMWVGPAADLKAPAGALVQDLTGKFVMPGMIDLHTHVSNSDVEVQDPVRFFTREGVTRDLQLYASYGVTSVVSQGTDQKPLVYEMRAEQRNGRPTMARIFTAGRGFTVKDGFPTNKGNVPGIPYEPATPAEAAAQMEELAADRPDVVKIWVDDRFGDFKKTPIEISRAIIDVAHKHGIKVVAHVYYLDDAKQLAAAGLDAFGHSVREKAVDAELIQLMKEHGTWIIPTLYREWATFMFEEPDQFLNDPFFARGLDTRQRTVLKSPEYHKALTGDKYFPRYPGILQTAKDNL